MKEITFYFDREGDLLEVLFSQEPGLKGTEDDRVMVRVNEKGDVLGLMICGVSTITGSPSISTRIPVLRWPEHP